MAYRTALIMAYRTALIMALPWSPEHRAVCIVMPRAHGRLEAIHRSSGVQEGLRGWPP